MLFPATRLFNTSMFKAQRVNEANATIQIVTSGNESAPYEYYVGHYYHRDCYLSYSETIATTSTMARTTVILCVASDATEMHFYYCYYDCDSDLSWRPVATTSYIFATSRLQLGRLDRFCVTGLAPLRSGLTSIMTWQFRLLLLLHPQETTGLEAPVSDTAGLPVLEKLSGESSASVDRRPMVPDKY